MHVCTVPISQQNKQLCFFLTISSAQAHQHCGTARTLLLVDPVQEGESGTEQGTLPSLTYLPVSLLSLKVLNDCHYFPPSPSLVK